MAINEKKTKRKKGRKSRPCGIIIPLKTALPTPNDTNNNRARASARKKLNIRDENQTNLNR